MDRFPKYYRSKKSYIDDELCEKFRDKYPKYSSINNAELKDILKRFNGALLNNVIENRNGVSLPQHLGNIVICSCTRPNKKIEAVNFYKDGKKVTYSNISTNNKLMKIFFLPNSVRYPFKYCNLWTFSFNQTEKRYMAKKYAENFERYIEIEKKFCVDNLYKDSKKNKIWKKHNELDLPWQG